MTQNGISSHLEPSSQSKVHSASPTSSNGEHGALQKVGIRKYPLPLASCASLCDPIELELNAATRWAPLKTLWSESFKTRDKDHAKRRTKTFSVYFERSMMRSVLHRC
jgi:hypothetical protein